MQAECRIVRSPHVTAGKPRDRVRRGETTLRP